MEDTRIIRFFSSLSLPSDTSDEEDAQIEKLGEEFDRYIWGDGGLADKLGPLRFTTYGNDIKLVLMQYHVFPGDERTANLKEVEDYRSKEKAVGLNCFVTNENFFVKTEVERRSFLQDTVLTGLNSLSQQVGIRKLDTDIPKLISDVTAVLKAWVAG
jgi:hypothetical protein